MAKTTQTAFDVNVLFGAAIQAVGTGADRETAVKAAAATLKNRTLLDCAQSFMRGEELESAIDAGKQAAAERASALLQTKGVDVADIEAVRAGLLPAFWTQDGQAGTPTATATGVDGEKPTAEAKAEARTLYNKIYARAKRMAAVITGEVSPEVVALQVPKSLQAEINAMEQRIAALKEQHTAELVNEAKRRYAEAVKAAKDKAKAKAKKAAK
jgi:hypothetical protein